MEAKLKAMRVAELREVLQRASVIIPGKANKADLIAKILASPTAVDTLQKQGVLTAPSASVPKQKAPELPHGGQDDDLLAPPEEFDWGPTPTNGTLAPSAADNTLKAVESATKADLKPESVKANAPKKQDASSSTQKPDPPPNVTTSDTQDEELERRRKRAARFGIPLVETKAKAGSVTNGAKANRSEAKPPSLTAEEAAKAERRAARFGIPTATPENKTEQNNKQLSQDNDQTSSKTGQKRTRSPALVDAEELEKRKKRAARFTSSGGDARAQT
ncbi:hypothetical protein K439DRAFT_507070 [Ramaria rubella]|nr:hypothetical protein K439DRAFT_507070 [Ramaria rubella]